MLTTRSYARYGTYLANSPTWPVPALSVPGINAFMDTKMRKITIVEVLFAGAIFSGCAALASQVEAQDPELLM
jgi:hypothetical protein